MLVAALACLALQPLVVFVSPNGDDANQGTLEQPMATLAAAVERIRSERSEGQVAELVLREGEHFLESTLILTPRDSDLTIQSAPGEQAIVTGARTVVPHNGSFENPPRPFDQLWLDDRLLPNGVHPNEGSFFVAGPVLEGRSPTTGELQDWTDRAFYAQSNDLTGVEATSRARAVVYHSWTTSHLPLASVDADGGVVLTSGRSHYPFRRWGAHQRYRFEGLPAFVDRPGEWAVDGGSTVVQGLDNQKLRAPQLTRFVQVHGSSTSPVQNLSIVDVTFRWAGFPIPDSGWSQRQAEPQMPAVIEASHTRDLRIAGCRFEDITPYAVWLRTGSVGATIEDNAFLRLGSGGIKIGEETRSGAGQTLVRDNVFRDGGLVHPSGVAIWVGDSGRNRILNNDIARFRYTGISLGWTWTYADTSTQDSIVSGNRIRHIGGDLSDLGGIYVLGRSDGTEISNNWISDVSAYGHYGFGAFGIYLDQSASNVTVSGNRVDRADIASLHIHYGRSNSIALNTFFGGNGSAFSYATAEGHLGATLSNNYLASNQELFRGAWQGDHVRWTNNFTDVANGSPFSGLVGLDDVAQLPSELRRRATLDPAWTATVGVDRDSKWAHLTGDNVVPLERNLSVSQHNPLRFGTTFDVQSDARIPPFMRAVNGANTSVSVSGSGGARALSLSDAPNQRAAFLPFLYFDPDHDSDMYRLGFEISCDPEAWLIHEWRDAPSSYQVGPRFEIREGRLRLSDRSLAVDGSVVITIENDLDRNRWTIRATAGEDEIQESFPLPTGFDRTDWIGWILNSDIACTCTIDNLRGNA